MVTWAFLKAHRTDMKACTTAEPVPEIVPIWITVEALVTVQVKVLEKDCMVVSEEPWHENIGA